MELQIGKMTSRQLATWFGLSYNTYKNDISKYLDILNWYCTFEKIYGGVIIQTVDKAIYDKTYNPQAQQIYLDEISRCVEEQGGLSSITGMARKCVSEKIFTSFDQAKRLLTIAGKQLFGKTANVMSYGPKGVREYVWGIKIDDFNHYRFMTVEEEQLFNEIIQTKYMKDPDIVKKTELLKESLKNNEITVDQYFAQEEELQGLYSFKGCIFAFKEETGEQISRCTKHELMDTISFAQKEGNFEFQ